MNIYFTFHITRQVPHRSSLEKQNVTTHELKQWQCFLCRAEGDRVKDYTCHCVAIQPWSSSSWIAFIPVIMIPIQSSNDEKSTKCIFC